MSKIQYQILSKYNIDISQVNLMKLYGLGEKDISDEEVEKKIQEAKRKWQNSVQNGYNEKIKKRDSERLAMSERYEGILRNSELRKEIILYYVQREENAKESSNEENSKKLAFAEEFFAIISSSKKITKEDVEFYFSYYRETGSKNVEAILELLKKKFKYNNKNISIDFSDDYQVEEHTSSISISHFQKDTVFGLKKCQEHLEQASKYEEICAVYPMVQKSMYELLELNRIHTADEFREYTEEKAREVYNRKQEHGGDFANLIDFYNDIKTIACYRDVIDNFEKFKLLVRFSALTPYMFELIDVKQDTIKQLFAVAQREYAFRDMNDFLSNYFCMVYENFGICIDGIHSLIKKAGSKSVKNRFFDMMNELFGKEKRKKLPIQLEILHFLVYWPIYLLLFTIVLVRVVCKYIRFLKIPASLLTIWVTNEFFPKIFDIPNLWIFKQIPNKEVWYPVVEQFSMTKIKLVGRVPVLSLVAIVVLLLIYVGPAIFTYVFVDNFQILVNKNFDFCGLENTFIGHLHNARNRMDYDYQLSGNYVAKTYIPKVLINIAMTVLIVMAIIWLPILIPRGWKYMSKKV